MDCLLHWSIIRSILDLTYYYVLRCLAVLQVHVVNNSTQSNNYNQHYFKSLSDRLV